MNDIAPPRPAPPARHNPSPNAKQAPSWTFEQMENGLYLLTLSGGGRCLTLYLYPAEFKALRAAAAYDVWAEEAPSGH